MFWKRKKSSKVEANVAVFGSPGRAKVHHPWDDLMPCPCGCKKRPLLMYEKDRLYFCGVTSENVFAICSICGRRTEKSDVSTVIDNWNIGIINSSAEMRFYVMKRKDFCLNEMQEAQRFDLSKEEVSMYFERISLYINAHSYSAFRHMQKDNYVEPLSERQEVCSQNAIRCLIRGDFIQALHELLDVLSDNNKDISLNFNEYVVIKNIITMYEIIRVESILPT